MAGRDRDAHLVERADRVIPGGMYGHQSVALMPPGTPQFFTGATGCRLLDADGNRYIDFLCGYGPNLFGYGHARIGAAVREQMARGDTMTGPAPVMVELAEALTAMISGAEWAIFCKSGAEATSTALVAARAHRGRRKILVARGAYHGAHAWNSPRTAGVLAEDRAHLIRYDYNDAASLAAAAEAAGDDLAGIFVSPFRHDTFADQAEPDPDFARVARRICTERDALLILDEVRAGFRLSRDVSWSRIGVLPDLSCWGKVLGNGQPISALLGSERTRAAAEAIYVTGSFWFSAVPMAAALATLRLVRDSDYLERIARKGLLFREGLDEQAARHGFGLRQTGPVTMPMLRFEEDPDFRLGYGFVAAAMRRGVYLSPYHNMFVCAAMTEDDLGEALAATEGAFAELTRGRGSLSAPPQYAAIAAALEGRSR